MRATTTAHMPDDVLAKLTINGTVGEMRELTRNLKGFQHPNSKAVNEFFELVTSTINKKLALEGDE